MPSLLSADLFSVWFSGLEYDALMGEQHTTVGSEELLGRLFGILTIRGHRMLDIGVNENGRLLLMFRRVVESTVQATEVAADFSVSSARSKRS
jgi:hypothetical protein